MQGSWGAPPPPQGELCQGPVSVLDGACVCPRAAPAPDCVAPTRPCCRRCCLSLFPACHCPGAPLPGVRVSGHPQGPILVGLGSCPRRLGGQQFTAACRAGSGSPRTCLRELPGAMPEGLLGVGRHLVLRGCLLVPTAPGAAGTASEHAQLEYQPAALCRRVRAGQLQLLLIGANGVAAAAVGVQLVGVRVEAVRSPGQGRVRSQGDSLRAHTPPGRCCAGPGLSFQAGPSGHGCLLLTSRPSDGQLWAQGSRTGAHGWPCRLDEAGSKLGARPWTEATRQIAQLT